MTTTQYTKDERDMMNSWAMDGSASIVHKTCKGWSVGYRDLRHPVIFKTKRDAIKAGSDWVCAMSLRKYQGAQS